MFNTSSQIVLVPYFENKYADGLKVMPHIITKQDKKEKIPAIEKDPGQKPQALSKEAAMLKKRLKKYDNVDEKKKLFFNVREGEEERVKPDEAT